MNMPRGTYGMFAFTPSISNSGPARPHPQPPQEVCQTTLNSHTVPLASTITCSFFLSIYNAAVAIMLALPDSAYMQWLDLAKREYILRTVAAFKPHYVTSSSDAQPYIIAYPVANRLHID